MNRRDLWKAPEEDGGVLVDPPLEKAEELVEINRRRLESPNIPISGRPLMQLRNELRQVTVALARFTSWTSRISDRAPPDAGPVVACGHQPELFHPGVWIKNFALSCIAQRGGLVPLYVDIDTDLIKKSSVTFPIWDPDPLRVQTTEAAFDSPSKTVPFCNRWVSDQELFQSFAISSKPLWRNWGFTPLLLEFWEEMLDQYRASPRRTVAKATEHGIKIAEPVESVVPMSDRKMRVPEVIGLCFSRARRAFERDWGCKLYELPISVVGKSEFICHMLAELPRFHAVHNECLQVYRRKHVLASRTHPVPDLAAHGDYLEAPFWWFDQKDNRRHRVFVRTRRDSLDLTPSLTEKPKTVKRGDLGQLLELSKQGISIFTRALTTTMFLRLCVADLFIHGIGGAKYDELTDDIIRRYFGIEPPEYMVVSGTLRLPFGDKLFPRFGCGNPRRKARDVLWNPERYLQADDPTARQLAAEKQQWIEREPADSAGRQERFYQLHNLTMRLRDYVTKEQKEAEADLQRCEAEVAANRILTNREYSFVLYPEEKLRPFLTQFLK